MEKWAEILAYFRIQCSMELQANLQPNGTMFQIPVNRTGEAIHETLQARILEWVAFSFSRESSQPRDWT